MDIKTEYNIGDTIKTKSKYIGEILSIKIVVANGTIVIYGLMGHEEVAESDIKCKVEVKEL